MKKILSGFIGLFAVIGLVAGTGYALFTSTANINGMVLGTATPGLVVSLASESGYDSTIDLSSVRFAPLLPGESDWGEFWLKNTSIATTDPLSFNLQARITAAGGDWGVLSNAVQAKICLYDPASAPHCDEANDTEWFTLAQWNTAPRTLPGNPLAQSETGTHYVIVFQIPSGYDNGIAGKTITGMNVTITGTQVP